MEISRSHVTWFAEVRHKISDIEIESGRLCIVYLLHLEILAIREMIPLGQFHIGISVVDQQPSF